VVNKDKWAVIFSSNCDEQVKQEFRHELHIETKAFSDKYLGLPTVVGRYSTKAFDFMATRIKNLVGAWSGREASYARCEVLLKSVAQAVPTYSELLPSIQDDVQKDRDQQLQIIGGGVQLTIDIFIG